MLFKSAFLTIVILTEFTHGTIPLTTMDGSLICHESYSDLESRYVSYRERYTDRIYLYFKTRWRVNYKIVYDTVYKIREACCVGYEKVGSVCLRICDAGYQLDSNKILCQPICDPVCQNGSCTSPNTCTCNNGYENSTAQPNVCVPVCDRPCVNADCVAPDQCQCHTGYSKTDDDFSCAPLCTHGCIRGTCTAPNICTCDDGYANFELWNSICIPTCHETCVHGTCIAPDVCSCEFGYYQTSSTTCAPLCDNGCPNGECISPNMCRCNVGFKRNQIQWNVCDPVCSDSCVNGHCAAPETCACDDGYRKTDIANICEPVCQNCTNGNCTGPNVCTCFEGYENDSNATCVPSCNCINGTCTAPDTCQCHPGFAFAKGNASLCLPECNAGCTNGECIEPDICSCYEGFVKLNDSSDGICIEACHNGSCQHGDCQSDGYCQCYYGWSERTCDTPTMCVLILEEDAGFREVNEMRQNDTMFESPWNGPTCDDSCFENIDNETLCYNDTTHAIPRVACFLRPDSRCKFLDLNADSLLRNSTVIGTSGAILVLILGSALGFVIFLKYKKKTNDVSVIINRDLLHTLLEEDSGYEPHEETIN